MGRFNRSIWEVFCLAVEIWRAEGGSLLSAWWRARASVEEYADYARRWDDGAR